MRPVIFDLDGTLVDSLRDIAEAMNEVLAGLDRPPHPVEAYGGFIGEGAAELVRRALSDDSRFDDAFAAFRATYATRLVVHTRPFEGVEATLARLWEAGVPTAVLSNKPHAATVGVVEAVFPAHRFLAVYGQREDVPKKPDPSAAFGIASELALAPETFFFVGDSAVDVRTALNAAMESVGVTWGQRPFDELRAAGVHHRIESMEALLDLVL